jgi:hypothetical protein
VTSPSNRTFASNPHNACRFFLTDDAHSIVRAMGSEGISPALTRQEENMENPRSPAPNILQGLRPCDGRLSLRLIARRLLLGTFSELGREDATFSPVVRYDG